MSKSTHPAALEALLFIHGEPLTRRKIMSVLELDAAALDAALAALRAELRREERGLTLLSQGDKVQLVTKPDFGRLMEKFVKGELTEDLSPASLEALSLVLYLGPLTRSRLDYLRGVNSSFILRSLLLRGLVERIPNPEKPAFFLYQATPETLRHLGLAAAEELPEYAKFREMENSAAEPPAPGSAETT